MDSKRANPIDLIIYGPVKHYTARSVGQPTPVLRTFFLVTSQ